MFFAKAVILDRPIKLTYHILRRISPTFSEFLEDEIEVFAREVEVEARDSHILVDELRDLFCSIVEVVVVEATVILDLTSYLKNSSF